MNSLIKALASKKIVRFSIYAVLGVVAVAGVLVIGFFYFLAVVFTYNQVQKDIDTPKYQAKMEQVADRVIPPDFVLTKSKFYPSDIDNNYRLIRTYTVNKPREVVIDELLRSLKAQGYSPEVDDYSRSGYLEYTVRDQSYPFSIKVPYEEPLIHIEVYVVS